MANQNKKPIKRWAVAKKEYYKVIAVYFDKAKAESYIKGQTDIYEVREVLD